MAHLIDSMAYAGQTPWHGLGHALSPNQPLEVWAKQARMDWRIDSTPVRFADNGHLNTQDMGIYPERQVLYRSDTKTPLSVVSDRYKIVQPEEILEFYRDLTEQAGFELETAGVLKGGKKLWALAKTGQSGVLKGNDTTNGYVLLATACDGTMSTTAQFTSVRVVCNNTLALALREGHGQVRVPHSTTFQAQSVKQQLGISVSAWDEFMYGLKTLSERKVDHKEADAYLRSVLMPQSQIVNDHTTRSKAPSRAASKALSLFEGHGKGSQLASTQGTAYGLLNAVTQFVDHDRRSRSNDHRLDSAWFGSGAVIKGRALKEALALVA